MSLETSGVNPSTGTAEMGKTQRKKRTESMDISVFEFDSFVSTGCVHVNQQDLCVFPSSAVQSIVDKGADPVD